MRINFGNLLWSILIPQIYMQRVFGRVRKCMCAMRDEEEYPSTHFDGSLRQQKLWNRRKSLRHHRRGQRIHADLQPFLQSPTLKSTRLVPPPPRAIVPKIMHAKRLARKQVRKASSQGKRNNQAMNTQAKQTSTETREIKQPTKKTKQGSNTSNHN